MTFAYMFRYSSTCCSSSPIFSAAFFSFDFFGPLHADLDDTETINIFNPLFKHNTQIVIKQFNNIYIVLYEIVDLNNAYIREKKDKSNVLIIPSTIHT